MAIPVSLNDAARHLRYEDGEELPPGRRADVEGFIADAAAWVEDHTGHILEARDVEEQVKGFCHMHLRAWPIANADTAATVRYWPDGGSAVTIEGARVVASSRPVVVFPPVGTRWPRSRGNVVVTVRAGYEVGDAVPGNLRRAMLVLIAAYDADREGGEVFAKAEAVARRLCRNFRLRRL